MDSQRVRRILGWVAALIAITIGVSLPALYFHQGLSNERAASAATAHAHAVSVSRIINRSPETWRFQENLLIESLELQRVKGTANEQALRIVGTNSDAILTVGSPPLAPTITSRAELRDSGKVVAHIEHVVGLRALLQRTLLVSLVSLLLASGIYAVLRFIPLKAVDRALSQLQAQIERAEAALAEKSRTEDALRKNEEWLLRRARHDSLLEAMAAAANDARTPHEAISACLRQLCEFTGWPLGHAALVDVQGDWAISKEDYWHGADAPQYRRVIEVTNGYRYPIKDGQFAGKVIRTGAPVWIKDLSKVGSFARQAAFSGSGLASGICFPITRERTVIGFFEFYTPQSLEPDDDISGLVLRAGTHVNRVAERVAANEQVTRLNMELERKVAERSMQMEHANELLVQKNRETELVGEMASVLQIAENLEEAGDLVARYLPSTLNGVLGGALYVLRASRDSLERLSAWGAETAEVTSAISFAPAQCWGMRRGQPHGSHDGAVALPCAHLAGDNSPGGTLCLPLVAQGESLGVLLIRFVEAGSVDSRRERLATAKRIAEQLSLALANVRLRDSLREQSIRDTLTGLHNRRYLEETMSRELARSMRENQSLALFMLDVDHFKRYNDSHGHDAGDAVLRSLGHVLRDSARASDIACRFGGEEFTFVLPNTGKAAAQAWSERLMSNVRQMEVRLGNRVLPAVTISMGLALYPDHGNSTEVLIKTADSALYEAKRAGRDRLIVAELSRTDMRVIDDILESGPSRIPDDTPDWARDALHAIASRG